MPRRKPGKETFMNSTLRVFVITLWFVMFAALPSLCGGCVVHDHGHYDSVDFVDVHGYHHQGYYDDHHGWHGGYYDDNHGYHDDPHDWHQ
jgi:hypothetical protein